MNDGTEKDKMSADDTLASRSRTKVAEYECSHCGVTVEENAVKCPACGLDITEIDDGIEPVAARHGEQPLIKMTGLFKLGTVANIVISLLYTASAFAILGSFILDKSQHRSLILGLLFFGLPGLVAVLNIWVSVNIRRGKGSLRLYRFSTLSMAALTFFYFTGGAPIGKVGFPIILIVIVINHVSQSDSRIIGRR